jgi:hypothetical protein
VQALINGAQRNGIAAPRVRRDFAWTQSGGRKVFPPKTECLIPGFVSPRFSSVAPVYHSSTWRDQKRLEELAKTSANHRNQARPVRRAVTRLVLSAGSRTAPQFGILNLESEIERRVPPVHYARLLLSITRHCLFHPSSFRIHILFAPAAGGASIRLSVPRVEHTCRILACMRSQNGVHGQQRCTIQKVKSPARPWPLGTMAA